jgi:hypothetical protein
MAFSLSAQSANTDKKKVEKSKTVTKKSVVKKNKKQSLDQTRSKVGKEKLVQKKRN